MNIKQFLGHIKKNLPFLLSSIILGAVTGALIYQYYPNKFVSLGSFYITRTTQAENTGFYNYDGYYSQQTALSYTSTFIGFLESIDIRKQALEDLNINVNESSLRKFGRLIRAKKAAPQLVSLEIKGETSQEAQTLWQSVADNSLETANALNANSDQLIRIYPLQQDPVVKEAYRNLYLNIVVGSLAGLVLAVFTLSFFKK